MAITERSRLLAHPTFTPSFEPRQVHGARELLTKQVRETTQLQVAVITGPS